jgi:hypothetical protein
MVDNSLALRALVKAQQDMKYQRQIKTDRENIGYWKRGRKIYGTRLRNAPFLLLSICDELCL